MKTFKIRYPYVLTSVFIGLVFSVFILYAGVLGYEAIQKAKFEVFLLLFGGYLFLMFLFALELVLAKQLKPVAPWNLWKKASIVQRMIVLYWGASLVSALCSPYREQTLIGMSRYEGLLSITLYCGCFLCVSTFARVRMWMVYLLGAVMSVFCAICIIQMMGYNPLGLYPEGYNYLDAAIQYAGIFLGTIGNANLVAALLCLVTPVFGIMLLRAKERGRWLLTIPLALCLITVFWMDVKAGILGVVLGMVLMSSVVLPISGEKKGAIWIGMGVILCGAVVMIWNSDRTWGMIYEMREVLHGNWDNSFGTGRIYIWKQVLELIPQHPWLGTGPDTMMAAYIPGYVRQNQSLGVSTQFWVDTAHNEYLNILYHQGILAFIPYFTALVCSAAKWVQKSSKNGFVAVWGGAILCYCIQAFFGFSMCQTAGLFWVFWALLEYESNHTEGSL